MNKGVVYYTNNQLPPTMLVTVQDYIEKSGLPIVSVSLKPIEFGKNIVVDMPSGIITMFNQILIGLEESQEDVVFLCEHDVMYHPSHFEFTPISDEVYFFNANNWRWDYPKDRVITYDHLTSLSGICASRQLLLNHYKKRLELIKSKGWVEDSKEPAWVRQIGYEPGKKRRRGGFMDEETFEWRSQYPNIDIRHKRTLTPPKVTLESFRHQPTGWQEARLNEIKGWDKEVFKI